MHTNRRTLPSRAVEMRIHYFDKINGTWIAICNAMPPTVTVANASDFVPAVSNSPCIYLYVCFGLHTYVYVCIYSYVCNAFRMYVTTHIRFAHVCVHCRCMYACVCINFYTHIHIARIHDYHTQTRSKTRHSFFTYTRTYSYMHICTFMQKHQFTNI